MLNNPLQNRHDFILLFDVKDGNPNGDPDGGNLPRIDAETGEGLVTDVCLKRKVRNFVALKHGYQPPHDIYVKEKSVLTETRGRAYEALKLPKGENAKEKNAHQDEARQWMCKNFYDIRTFGAVMSLKSNKCGQVRGPVQLTFARSVHPIISQEHSITRMAVETEEISENQEGDNRTMGRKHTVPYGLYRAHGFVSASLAKQTGFGAADIDLLWEALENMFEHDRSAARGEMAVRGLYVFRHDQELGNAPAHKLFASVTVTPKSDTNTTPRGFDDFTVTAEDPGIAGVTMEKKSSNPRTPTPTKPPCTQSTNWSRSMC